MTEVVFYVDGTRIVFATPDAATPQIVESLYHNAFAYCAQNGIYAHSEPLREHDR